MNVPVAWLRSYCDPGLSAEEIADLLTMAGDKLERLHRVQRRVTSVLIGASSVAQLDANLAAVDRLGFDDAELARIDEHAVDAGINLWARSSES